MTILQSNDSTLLPDMHKDARAIFKAGLTAVDPEAAIIKNCHRQGEELSIGDKQYNLSKIDHVYVVGAGKATAPMAMAMETILGDRIDSGCINVKSGHESRLKKIIQVSAGHPIPDQSGVDGARDILSLVSNAGKNDLIVALLSGGGSALLTLPVTNITIEDKQKTTQTLLSCGATIHEINAIRKHLSQIKGGQLVSVASPATVVSLILSDVVGDDLDVIASGPTVPDPSTFAQCQEIIAKYEIGNQLPVTVVKRIQDGNKGRWDETPKPTDSIFKRSYTRIIGSNSQALAAARSAAEARGYHTLILSSMVEGDTYQAAGFHAAIAKEVVKTGHPVAPPACILSGGETTVRVTGKGKGGRNQAFALSAAIVLEGCAHTMVLAAGTDGTDGPTDAAGAAVDHTTTDRAHQMGLDPKEFLDANDAYHFFKQLGDLLITGPTQTNVMDLRVMLIR